MRKADYWLVVEDGAMGVERCPDLETARARADDYESIGNSCELHACMRKSDCVAMDGLRRRAPVVAYAVGLRDCDDGGYHAGPWPELGPALDFEGEDGYAIFRLYQDDHLSRDALYAWEDGGWKEIGA